MPSGVAVDNKDKQHSRERKDQERQQLQSSSFDNRMSPCNYRINLLPSSICQGILYTASPATIVVVVATANSLAYIIRGVVQRQQQQHKQGMKFTESIRVGISDFSFDDSHRSRP